MVSNTVLAALHILGYTIATPFGAALVAAAVILGGIAAANKLTGVKFYEYDNCFWKA